MAANGPKGGGGATCCFCYCQFFFAGGSDQMLVGWTPSVNRFAGNDNLCPGHTDKNKTTTKKKKKKNEPAPISSVPELERFSLSSWLFIRWLRVRETHPPTEREKAEKVQFSSVENEIKVIDRLPVASFVDATPPRPTSVSHPQLW